MGPLGHSLHASHDAHAASSSPDRLDDQHSESNWSRKRLAREHQERCPLLKVAHQNIETVLGWLQDIYYSDRYTAGEYEYRHVIITKAHLAAVPKEFVGKMLAEEQWRGIGIQQSPGWEHYMVHLPEPVSSHARAIADLRLVARNDTVVDAPAVWA
ncbi:cyclin-dependent kinase regulatory subunit-domain-containing protein [Polychytrium aggregatum]|uniref:cyclin-dependent kinase regulatory subunit-domain-containing protein n=1 Tax=Polychytrium aggregatum TaxID=110093 RepID=UPI0022FE9153|nr:cyclin-dependent kinase regulatory subunit-domain-containing protein [Polychytrium aggregatum]KAI9204037.1 cyclin-dependent kinase regulatory subunit-domain-containing protein [Polychytrium aggregatum]